MVLTEIILAEFHVCQQLVEFYICNLEYEWDLVPIREAVTSWCLLSLPLSIIWLELRKLTKTGLCPLEMLQYVERYML